MNEDQYKLYYYDPTSLLVITSTGEIKKLLCPFPVRCLWDIHNISAGDTVMVQSITTEPVGKENLIREIIIFVINEHKIYYWYFSVL